MRKKRVKEFLTNEILVGPGLEDVNGKIVPLVLKEGDAVLLPTYGGHEVKIGDEEFQLFKQNDILGKFE